MLVSYRKSPKISIGLIFGQSPFFGPPENKPRAYFREGLFSEGLLRFKDDWAYFKLCQNNGVLCSLSNKTGLILLVMQL